MRKWMGFVCVALGAACLLTAVGLVFYHRWEADSASEFSQSLLEEVQRRMEEIDVAPDSEQEVESNPASGDEPDAAPHPVVKEMPTILVDGYECIGILSVPVLELELPIVTDWSYVKLKKVPCLYYGSYNEKNFVIAAHNYKSHFGRLSKLQAGDAVIFTDVTGAQHYYEVVLLETLPATATEEMITGGFDLSLYTCTIGGGSRVTVRCNRVS